jgi:L-aspartate semialdehyde sulfurtransferase
VDYSVQRRNKPVIEKVSYEELRSGKIMLNNKEVPTGSISSYYKARQIAGLLKDWIGRANSYCRTR